MSGEIVFVIMVVGFFVLWGMSMVVDHLRSTKDQADEQVSYVTRVTRTKARIAVLGTSRSTSAAGFGALAITISRQSPTSPT